MLQFIELTSKGDGKRIAVNVETIRQVLEKENGCSIVTAEDAKEGFSGWGIEESYHTVMAMLTGKI